MGTVIVDGIEVEVGDHERLNGIQAAERAGIDIPRYCWHPGLSVVASCRMCLCESGTRDPATGKITVVPKLVPACQTPAKDNTVFVTNSERVIKARAMVEEDLLLTHPVDCPICDKAGECYLQDYHFEHGQTKRRADIRPFTSRRRDVGPTVTLFVDRCVMCTRCVRFTREISGTSELMVVNRGAHEEIDTFPNFPLDNKMAGNVVDLCPVGALGDKDFLYRQRVWFMKQHPGVCTGCSTGCSTHVEENQNVVYRLKPRENPHVNQWWLCDEGRYGYHYANSKDRLTMPARREEPSPQSNGSGPTWMNLDWTTLPDELTKRLSSAGRLAGVFSPHMTVEEAYLLAKYLRKLDPQAVLALGPVPVEGEDQRFKNGFTIRAEKCPNRRGVEAVLQHFGGVRSSFEELAAEVEAGKIGGVWITGGYPKPWVDDAIAAQFAHAKTLIVEDLFDSPLMQAATYRLPGTSFAEREGSYVNHDMRLQTATWAIRPPGGVLVEGRLYWRLLGMTGLFKSRTVLDEIAREITFFAAAADPIPETGVDLRVNQLAETTETKTAAPVA